ncbi:hypothetical protein [Thalassotalea marina]|uniref:Uncharacterized protein n=1 Tax=Thalassotalea marina TaxID=1673741 RepID=A0A919EL39_9GAMM|nr:hypothetical protein [Thalassotalea marina]GHF94192.1 hypothetical protein GCM10017161_23040 [Thalassotalea marina]
MKSLKTWQLEFSLLRAKHSFWGTFSLFFMLLGLNIAVCQLIVVVLGVDEPYFSQFHYQLILPTVLTLLQPIKRKK